MLSEEERAVIRESMEYWAARMPLVRLEQALKDAKKFLKVYPGTQQTEMNIEVIETEILARENRYLDWLETR